MPTSFPGASSSSGHGGLLSGPGKPVSRSHATHDPVLFIGIDISGAIDIQSNQETDRKVAYQ